MISPELALPLTLVVPLIGFVAIWLLDKQPNFREAATLVTGGVLLALTISIFMAVGAGERPEAAFLEVMEGAPISFRAEPLGAMFAVIASGLWVVNSLYSIGYMRGHHEKHQTRFFMCFAIAISAAIGVAYAANLFTLFVFYEVLTLSTFPLVTHKGDDKARNGGRVYLGILLATSIGLFLPAIVWTYAIAGTTDFTVGGLLARHVDEAGPVAGILMALYAFGIGKAALMPVHPWLPNAMVAPTPVSAFLHAVAVVKAGVFSILKVAVYIFGIDFLDKTGASTPILWIAAGSIILASAIAMHKDNLKARLAYSTVSQLSYVTLGAMLATSTGVMGAGLQIAAHALGKMTLFMCAGAVMVAAHKENISDMRGLGRKMPITFGAFFIGAMSIIGLPPLAGSWPKFFLMLGAIDAQKLWIVGVLILSSILNVIYLLSIPVQAFYMSPETKGGKAIGAAEAELAPIDWRNLKEAPFLCVLPPVLTALGAFLLFFFANGLYDYLAPILETQP
ncbi:MAG: proton-conducting transporter membrane subunit [Parvularculaceae bacterium]|nr:monovalent cation/H+ antiporter subunit D family protein [Amphiplicatus sp.]HRX38383.1 proton-conducting transporter membrane subunit [Parvularculaceae bacterium]